MAVEIVMIFAIQLADSTRTKMRFVKKERFGQYDAKCTTQNEHQRRLPHSSHYTIWCFVYRQYETM